MLWYHLCSFFLLYAFYSRNIILHAPPLSIKRIYTKSYPIAWWDIYHFVFLHSSVNKSAVYFSPLYGTRHRVLVYLVIYFVIHFDVNDQSAIVYDEIKIDHWNDKIYRKLSIFFFKPSADYSLIFVDFGWCSLIVLSKP